LLPPGLTHLSADDNRLTKLPALPDTLTELSVTGNLIPEFTAFPPNLVRLFICRNPAPGPLPALPRTLEWFYANMLGIKALPQWVPTPKERLYATMGVDVLPEPLPPKLQRLYVSDNNLTSLPPLPATLEQLDMSHNCMTQLPTPLPPGLKLLSAVSNLIAWLPDEAPSTLTDFWFDYNQLPNEEEGETIEQYLAAVKPIFERSKNRAMQRTSQVSEELMQAVWNPDRLLRMIEQHGCSRQWNHEQQSYVGGFDFQSVSEVL